MGFDVSIFAVERTEEYVSIHYILLCTVREDHVKTVIFTLFKTVNFSHDVLTSLYPARYIF
jgi:hypothetical protein